MVSTGSSLWLMPKKGTPLYEALRALIGSLSPLFDDGHEFEPHVTLTSDIHISSQAQADAILDRALIAVRSVSHIDAIVTGLDYGPQFTRKVYLNLKPTPELVGLAQISREEFVLAPQMIKKEVNYHALSHDEREAIDKKCAAMAEEWAHYEYKPHLSLVYSNLYPVEEALRGTINTRLSDTFGPNYESRGIGWTNGTLSLVLTEGEIEQWQKWGTRNI